MPSPTGRHGRRTTSPALTAVVGVLATVAVSCAGSASGAPLPKASPVIDVNLADNRFVFNPAVPSGQVVFRVHNAGQVDHELELIPLPPDVPPIDVQLHGAQRRNVLPLVKMAARPPNGSGTFAVNLKAGTRYALVCFLLALDGQAYALKGMNAEFTPSGPPPTR